MISHGKENEMIYNLVSHFSLYDILNLDNYNYYQNNFLTSFRIFLYSNFFQLL